MIRTTVRSPVLLVLCATLTWGCSTAASSDAGAAHRGEDETHRQPSAAYGAPRDQRDGVVATVTVKNGRVVNGPGTLHVSIGEQVTLKVSADRADEVHVHGYDRTAEVEPDKPATIRFSADIPGQFAAELEQTHLTLIEIQVQ
jgi:hypothetical protein